MASSFFNRTNIIHTTPSASRRLKILCILFKIIAFFILTRSPCCNYLTNTDCEIVIWKSLLLCVYFYYFLFFLLSLLLCLRYQQYCKVNIKIHSVHYHYKGGLLERNNNQHCVNTEYILI